MKQMYSVLFLDKSTKQTLKRFDYPASKIISKFFWEKMKAQELDKLTRSRMIDSQDVIVRDVSTIN